MRILFFLMISAVLITGCNCGPKVIAPSSETEESSEKGSGIFTSNPEIQVTTGTESSFNDGLHKVVVQEVLQANRYVYLNVKEEGNGRFWIASRKQDAKKGEIYFYRRPLLKTNFESKEYNRVFDTIYLVSNLVSQDHSKHAVAQNTQTPKIEQSTAAKEDNPTHTNKVVHKGTLKIAELVKDPKKYEGHTIQLSGKCVRVNPNIMERNWLHIQDGSKNDFDLVVTSNTFVPEGSDITIRGVVSINRDFGAGYKYDLIVENGTLVQ